MRSAKTLQCFYRLRKAQKEVQRRLRHVYEKVYDETSCEFFYYNVRTGTSSWRPPSILHKGTRLLSPDARLEMEDKVRRGIWKSADEMTDLEAATTLQSMFRTFLAKARVRNIIHAVFEKAIDPETGEAYYFNTRTGCMYPPVLSKEIECLFHSSQDVY